MTPTGAEARQAPWAAVASESISRRVLEERLAAGQLVDAIVDDLAYVKIDTYAPLVCAAIHDGHRLRPPLAARCRLTEDERRYEEDPFTGALIRPMPITIVALDSRYEYDLNRPRSQCVYTKAWGREVWKRKLPLAELRRSRKKHEHFYTIFDALVGEVERRFGACCVLDVHAYNHGRQGSAPPTFNLGTSQIDGERWEAVLQRLERALHQVVLPSLEVRVARDEVFRGRGYLAAHVNAGYADTLVVPIEVAKVFMDEDGLKHFPMLLEELRLQLKHAFAETGAFFARKFVRPRLRRGHLLPGTITNTVRNLDKRLHKLARNVETLRYVNPMNIAAEKKRFLAKRGEQLPAFHYRQLNIDPYRFREELYRLPVRKIRDPDIQALYRETIDRLAVRIELITTLGSESFLYNSLRYYGEPTERDLANAKFLLHAADLPNAKAGATVGPAQACEFFVRRAEEWKLPVRVELSTRLVAKAMVESRRKTLLVNRRARFTPTELEALSHHELGIHLVTTLNGRAQPLRVFSLGLPGNTEAQEGMAVLCEYLSGHLTLERLRTLALRVIAVYQMTRRNDFRHTFALLRNEYGLARGHAFDLCLRVYRGGGFTKDYLYLRGLKRALEVYREGDFVPMLVGKVGFEQRQTISELMQRGILHELPFRAPAMDAPAPSNELIDYLLAGIK